MFSCEICEILNTTFLVKHRRATASEVYDSQHFIISKFQYIFHLFVLPY